MKVPPKSSGEFKDVVPSLAVAVLNTYDLGSLTVDKISALQKIENELLFDYDDLNSEAVIKARFNRYQIGSPEDYTENIYTLKNRKVTLCGIRHEACNPDLPFIRCIPNFEIESKMEALSIAEEVFENFKVFNPRHICFWSSKQINADMTGSVYMVSTAENVLRQPNIPNKGQLTLETVKDISYYEWYEKGYAEFHLYNPELKWKVTINSKETMGESLEQGLLFYAKSGEERIGLIAAIKSDFLTSSGIYFNEIFISNKWKGLGLAKILQRKFIEQKCNIKDIIWGTIDAENHPSMRTALANGRKPIRFESFFEL